MGERFASTPGPPPSAARRAPRAGEADLQSLLARAVHELAERTGAPHVVAWSAGPDGRPRVQAAAPESPLREPEPEAWRLVARLEDATDLGAPDAPSGAAALAAVHGVSAAAPVRRAEGEPGAVLLLGAEGEPPGAVRPRTLAALRAAAARLAGPAAAALAAARLGRLDREVQRLDRLAALGGLVAEIVHEIRNPLVSVKTFLQLLPERAEDPEFRESFLEVAAEELRRIERLVEAVLEHARPRGGPRDEDRAALAPALEAVRRLVAFRAAERGVEVHASLPEDLPAPRLGEDALRQVLLNLLLNALDATPEGGRVSVRAVPDADGEGIALLVDDAGGGVPPALRERIFEPFFSTREGQAGGLGLAICRRIVEDAGGAIEVGDAPGGGSRFRVRLPARPRDS